MLKLWQEPLRLCPGSILCLSSLYAPHKQAVLIGSLIPLVMYSAWEAVFLGNVPFEAGVEGAQRMQVVQALGGATSRLSEKVLQVFSACAIASSMAGASVSLVDFFADAISSRARPDSKANSEGEGVEEAQRAGAGRRRVAAAGLGLAPPLALAFAYPDAFLGALENAGLLGGVSLYGLLPGIHAFVARLVPAGMLGRRAHWSERLRSLVRGWCSWLVLLICVPGWCSWQHLLDVAGAAQSHLLHA